MRNATFSLIGLLTLVVAVPAAQAQEASCVTGVDALCEASEAAFFDEAFGEWGDVALIVLGLFLVALLLNAILWVVFKLKPRRLLRMSVNEKVREVEPGGSVRYKVEIENALPRQPVEIFLEHDSVPSGWQSHLTAATVLPSGFRVPHEVGETTSMNLSSSARGSNRAIVEVVATAPRDAVGEETVELEVRAVPVLNGHVKKRGTRKVPLTILLVPHLPKVEILRVTHRPERINVGQPVLTTATVVNKGEREAHDVAVSFTVNGAEMDKKVVPALSVQASAEVEFNWTPQSGENKIRVSVAT